uniref:Apple domain-containing protein n=1 Tax=Plectus sambesii TaxID=2011161 RepID=A0A914V6M0_9BILA
MAKAAPIHDDPNRPLIIAFHRTHLSFLLGAIGSHSGERLRLRGWPRLAILRAALSAPPHLQLSIFAAFCIANSPMARRLSLLLLAPLFASSVRATTEWYGDERAQAAPADAAGFYDIIYDEAVCPNSELKSNAVPDYVYFGAMMAAFAVNNHLGCLRECLSNSKCRSANYYKPMTYQRSGYCELLSETQYDNPRAMRPIRDAVYFERIHCRVDEYDLPT